MSAVAARNTPKAAPQPPRVSSFAMIRTLGGVATLSGVLLVMVYQGTLPRIKANQEALVREAVFQVVPSAAEQLVFQRQDSGELEPVAGVPASGKKRVFAAYDAEGKFVGVALEAATQGYQDTVRILFGYDPAREAVTGIIVLESKETPGLGDRIGKDPEFLANFEALDVRLNDDKTALRNPIVVVKNGTKTEPWQIDGISGATISSKAVGKMLNEACNEMLPYLASRAAQLREKPVGN